MTADLRVLIIGQYFLMRGQFAQAFELAHGKKWEKKEEADKKKKGRHDASYLTPDSFNDWTASWVRNVIIVSVM